MRCELVQRPTIFKADRPMNHELVSSHHCLSCNKFRAQLRAAKRKSQTTIFPSEVFTPSNQLRMWHFPVSANLINLKLPWFFLLLVNCSKCLAIVRPCPHLTFLSSEIWGFFFFFFFNNHTKETDLFFFVPAGYEYTGGTLGMHSIMVNYKTKEPRRRRFWKAPISLDEYRPSQAKRSR